MARYWTDTEPVNGDGLPLDRHAQALAEALDLTQPQVMLLVSELRNALTPALILARHDGSSLDVLRCIERVVALADSIADRSRRPALLAHPE